MFIKSITPLNIIDFSRIDFGFRFHKPNFFGLEDIRGFFLASLFAITFFVLAIVFSFLSLTGPGAKEELKRLTDLQKKDAVTIFQGGDCGIIHKEFDGFNTFVETFEPTPFGIECHVQVF